MWVFTLSPRYIPSVRPLLLHFFTTQQRNDLINRSPSISAGPGISRRRYSRAGGNNVSQDARVKIAQRSGTGDPLSSLRSASFPPLHSFPLRPALSVPLLLRTRTSFARRKHSFFVSSSSTFSFVHTFVLLPFPPPLPSCHPVPLRADTRRSYALHIQGDCIIHKD